MSTIADPTKKVTSNILLWSRMSDAPVSAHVIGSDCNQPPSGDLSGSSLQGDLTKVNEQRKAGHLAWRTEAKENLVSF